MEKKFGRNKKALTFALRSKKRWQISFRIESGKTGQKIFESWETIARYTFSITTKR